MIDYKKAEQAKKLLAEMGEYWFVLPKEDLF